MQDAKVIGVLAIVNVIDGKSCLAECFSKPGRQFLIVLDKEYSHRELLYNGDCD